MTIASKTKIIPSDSTKPNAVPKIIRLMGNVTRHPVDAPRRYDGLKFVAALEASEAHPIKGTGRPIEQVLASREDIHRLRKLWEEKHGCCK